MEKEIYKSQIETIQAAKKYLDNENSKLDDTKYTSIKGKILKNKISKISNILKNLKDNG